MFIVTEYAALSLSGVVFIMLINVKMPTIVFSCSAQLSTKFQLLIKTKIPTNEEVYCFKSLRRYIYHANKC